jgi:hypothetical protein
MLVKIMHGNVWPTWRSVVKEDVAFDVMMDGDDGSWVCHA